MLFFAMEKQVYLDSLTSQSLTLHNQKKCIECNSDQGVKLKGELTVITIGANGLDCFSFIFDCFSCSTGNRFGGFAFSTDDGFGCLPCSTGDGLAGFSSSTGIEGYFILATRNRICSRTQELKIQLINKVSLS